MASPEKGNRVAILFVIKFVLLYIILNTAYGFYYQYFLPGPDPATKIVSSHVLGILSLFHQNLSIQVADASAFIAVLMNEKTVINIFEGCNGINVFIVYIAFIISFTGSLRSSIVFLIVGTSLLYISNLLRVSSLFWIAYWFPERLYFFHKYLFTAAIYLVVFALWFLWIRRVRRERGN